MLQLSGALLGQSVISLRTGAPVALVMAPVINPNNLKIEGFYCQDRFKKQQLILLTQDIREQNTHGFFINDQELLSEPSELIRLQKILDINFELPGKPVVTANKKRLGKVSDYAVDSVAYYVQKLYVGQSLIKSFSGGQLSVDRSQIIEITNKRIVVQNPIQPVKATAAPTALNAAPAG